MTRGETNLFGGKKEEKKRRRRKDLCPNGESYRSRRTRALDRFIKIASFFSLLSSLFFSSFFPFFFFFNRSIVSRRFETHQRYINLNRKIHLYPCNYLQLASKSVICSFARIDECSYTQQ